MESQSINEIDLLRAKTDLLNPALSADWARKKLVWVPSEKDGFSLASVVGDRHSDGTIDVELVETGERQRISEDDWQKPNPPKYDKCEDMAMLTCLNEASVLNNLKQRYFSNLYYTYSGLFCVVINPYKRIPIYTDSLAEQFKSKKRKEMPPHIFAVTDEAYRSMLQDRDDQSILCTGESGAGKTENTKKVIQYLTYIAGNRSLSKYRKPSVDFDTSQSQFTGQLEEQLLQANPILEAFGNSKTVKNDNSSRFGKFIRVHFDAAGCISGANIEFYLLEKSRVLKQAPNERTFHIFYQLLKGLTKSQREKYLLENDASKYRFLSNGDSKLGGIDDAAELAETLKAMSIIGLNDEELAGILKTVSAVLLFGNLEFDQENKNSDQAVLTNDAVAQKIASLLGVNVTELIRAFLKPKIKVQRDHVHRAQNVDQANFSVGAIAKAIYERLFRWLVHRLNKSLDRTRQLTVSFIGILDIAGFEIFDCNSFEQMCINYTNEKLQQLFNNTMFVREQQEYMDEGLEWKFMDFGLNLQPTIDLIEKPMGILSTLDDVCLFPQGSDQSFVQRLNNTHAQHSKYVVPEMRSRSDFAVLHYAGRVDYEVKDWRVKNMDPLNENVIDVLKSSKEALIVEMWKDVSDVCSLSATDSTSDCGIFGSRMAKKGMFRTVSQLHKEQLTTLMSTLNNTNPHFVRCIIPNHEKKHGVLNAQLVLDQLRCNGVLEGIRICRQGFPTRIPFQEFRQRYEKLLSPNVNPAGFMDGKEAVRRIIASIEIDENLYRIGQSKVFFRAGVIGELEEMRDQTLSSLIESFQAYCRGWLGRRILVRRRQQETAIRIIQRNGVAWMRLREWQWWRLFTKVKPLLEVTNKDELIAEREKELKVTAEKLKRSENLMIDYKEQLEKIDEERAILKHKLDTESVERAEIYEERRKILARKNELEERFNVLLKKFEAEEKKSKIFEEEKRSLMEIVRNLERNLQDEERSRQKLLLEKNTIEARLKEIEIQGVELESCGNKLVKEKRALEERCQHLSSSLIDETEKSKQLAKTKARLEMLVSETNMELEKEKQQRQAAETARRTAEMQLREEHELCLERTRKAEELSNQLTRKESELVQLNLRNDEDLSARQQMEREIRELKGRIEDALDDLDKEKDGRQKAEKARRDMAEELEGYKQELEESNDKTQLQSQMRTKRDEEYAHLKKQLEDTVRLSDEAMEKIKTQNLEKVEELLQLLDQLKRQKAMAEKAKLSTDAENENLRSGISDMSLARQEAEKKRKTAENQLVEKENKMREMQAEIDELTTKLVRTNAELDSAQKAKDAEITQNSNLLKKIAVLDMELSEMAETSEEDRRNRAQMSSRIKQLEEDLLASKEICDEAQFSREKAEKEVKAMKELLAEARKKLDEENRELVEEMRRKREKELAAQVERSDAAEQARDKAERAKKKALQEAEDAQKELSDMQSSMREIERQQRKFDQQIAAERSNSEKMVAERNTAQQMSREAESKMLVMSNELAELKEQLEQADRDRRNLRIEVDNLASTKDDTGKNLFELEKAKRRLEEELAKAEDIIVELEDVAQIAEDGKARLEVSLQAARADFERQMATFEEEEEDKRKSLILQNQNLTEELESERRARTQAVSSKKKLELHVPELTEQVDVLQRQNDEMSRQFRKLNYALKEVQMEATEARTAMDDALHAQREAEKRVRNAEDEVKRLNVEMTALGSSRRKLEAERDEVLDELANIRSATIMSEEKRRLEARIVELEDQLEEETAGHDLAQEKSKKAQQQLEQMTADLAMERSLCERSEAEKVSLERLNRELKQKLEDIESQVSARIRTQLSVAEAKIVNLEQQLATEDQEKLRQVRVMRRMESKLSDAVQLLEEEKRSGEQHRLSTERLNQRIRQLRNQLDEAESERDRLHQKLKEERRRADDLTDTNETLSRDVSMLKQRDSAAKRSSTLFSSRRFGSNSSLARGLDDFRPLTFSNETTPGDRDRPISRLTSGTGSQPGGNNTDEDRD